METISYLSGRFDAVAEELKDIKTKARVWSLELIKRILEKMPNKHYEFDIDNDEVIRIASNNLQTIPGGSDIIMSIEISEDGRFHCVTANSYEFNVARCSPDELVEIAGMMLHDFEWKREAKKEE